MWLVISASDLKLCPHHMHLSICLVCSAPFPNQTSCPRTSFLGKGIVSLISRLRSDLEFVDEELVFVLEGEEICGCGGKLCDCIDGTGTFTPQCLASFMWVVMAAKLGKLCLHQTHLSTSLACSAPLFNQWDCHALCLLLVELIGVPVPAIVLNNSSPPSLLSSLIFSKALVASLGAGATCLSLPFHNSGLLLAFGEMLLAAATAAAKYGRCEAVTGDGH